MKFVVIGGDAAGMNPAVRAAVRTGLHLGIDVFVVFEGLRGLVEGGDLIRPATSADVGGIMYRGGTVLGTARSEAFRTRTPSLTGGGSACGRSGNSIDGSLSG